MTINPMDLVANLRKMQDQLGAVQDRLSSIVVTGSSGGGMVEVDMTGKMELLAVRISPDALMTDDSGKVDLELLQDLIVSAQQAAFNKVKVELQGEAGSIAEGLGIPNGILG